MDFMTYANIVSTFALIVGAASLGWQIYTWKDKKNQEEKPVLMVVIKKKELNLKTKLPIALVRNLPHRTFYIQNNGKFGVQILSCFIEGISIESCSFIESYNNIIGAKIGPGNFVSSQILEGYEFSSNLQGKVAKIKCKLASGTVFEEEYTLSEEPL